MKDLVLLQRYKIRKAGERGHSITVPKSYMEDLQLVPGQALVFYRKGPLLVVAPEGTDVKRDEC